MSREPALAWATAALLAALVAVAAAVFVALPRWVEEAREPEAPGPAARESPPESSEVEAAEAASTPVNPEATTPTPTSAPTPAPARPAARRSQPPPPPRASLSGPPPAEPAPTEAERLRQAVEEHRRAARALETEERWREAAERYAEALALEPTLTFAREGRERALERAELAERLGYHLDHPERLSTHEVLAEAETLLLRAREVEAPGEHLRRQAADLGRLVEGYSVPVAATLLSDGVTEVTVYRVGRLGSFERRTLELRPGTYTVVGSRSGYRDVRRRLVVHPGRAPEPLAVRCEERI